MDSNLVKNGYNWAFISVVLQLVFAFAVSVIAMVIISIQVMESVGISDRVAFLNAAQDALVHNNMLMNLFAYGIADSVPVFIAMKCAKRKGKIKNWFSRSKLKSSELVMACFATLGIGVIDSLLIMVYNHFFGSSGIADTISDSVFTDSKVMFVITVFYICLLGPFLEEFLFRGFVLHELSQVSPMFGIVISAMLFGLFHGNFEQAINAFVLGMFFGYIALKANSIWPTVVMHIVNNSFSVLLTILSEKLALNDTVIIVINIALLVLGLIGFVFCFIRQGKLRRSEDLLDSENYVSSEETEHIKEMEGLKNLTLKLMFRCPFFYIAFACLIAFCMSTVNLV